MPGDNSSLPVCFPHPFRVFTRSQCLVYHTSDPTVPSSLAALRDRIQTEDLTPNFLVCKKHVHIITSNENVIGARLLRF